MLLLKAEPTVRRNKVADPFPGADEIREMFPYFEACTYFGPEREKHIIAATALVHRSFTTFADWARSHMSPSPASTPK